MAVLIVNKVPIHIYQLKRKHNESLTGSKYDVVFQVETSEKKRQSFEDAFDEYSQRATRNVIKQGNGKIIKSRNQGTKPNRLPSQEQ